MAARHHYRAGRSRRRHQPHSVPSTTQRCTSTHTHPLSPITLASVLCHTPRSSLLCSMAVRCAVLCWVERTLECCARHGIVVVHGLRREVLQRAAYFAHAHIITSFATVGVRCAVHLTTHYNAVLCCAVVCRLSWHTPCRWPAPRTRSGSSQSDPKRCVTCSRCPTHPPTHPHGTCSPLLAPLLCSALLCCAVCCVCVFVCVLTLSPALWCGVVWCGVVCTDV